MRLTYHERPGVAYLDLREPSDKVSKPVRSLPIAHPDATPGEDWWLVLDFDADGRLLGIEFLDPGAQLLPGAFANSERPAD